MAATLSSHAQLPRHAHLSSHASLSSHAHLSSHTHLFSTICHLGLYYISDLPEHIRQSLIIQQLDTAAAAAAT